MTWVHWLVRLMTRLRTALFCSIMASAVCAVSTTQSVCHSNRPTTSVLWLRKQSLHLAIGHFPGDTCRIMRITQLWERKLCLCIEWQIKLFDQSRSSVIRVSDGYFGLYGITQLLKLNDSENWVYLICCAKLLLVSIDISKLCIFLVAVYLFAGNAYLEWELTKCKGRWPFEKKMLFRSVS